MSRAGPGLVPFSQVALLQPVIAYFEARGIRTEKYLEMAEFGPGLLESDTSPIPTNHIFRFIDLVCSQEGIEDIGLLIGQTTSVQMLGAFGQRLIRTRTVGDYLRLGCRIISANASGDYYWLVNEKAGVRFCASVAGLQQPDTVQNYLYILLVTVNTIRQALGRPWCPAEMVVPGISSRTTAKLAMLLPETRILGTGSYASFPVPEDVLRQPMPSVVKRSAEQPDAASELQIPTNFKAAIGQLVENLIISGRPDIHTAAEIVGVNARTLQRRLAECGTHFSGLVAEARVALATRWIEEGDRSITDIALGLGYSDPANFSRAFHRIKGISPRAYRKALQSRAGDRHGQ